MWFKRYLLSLCVAFGLIFSGQTLLADDSFDVVVSIKPIHSILAGLMEGTKGPQLLVSGEQSPLEFKPTDQQKHAMQSADLVIWVGPELETHLAESIAALESRVRVIELLSSQSMKILLSRGDDTQRDPFFWLDDRNIIILLDDLTHLLVEADPLRTHIYQQNRRKLMQRLTRLDREYEYGYRGLKAGLGVQYYDTLHYFEQAYALTVLEHMGISPRQPGDAASLFKVRQRIVDGDAVCLLIEAGMSAEHAGLLTQGQEVNVGRLDSLGINLKPGPELYFQLMDHNTDTIKRCLNADMGAAEQARITADSSGIPDQEGIGGRFILTDHLGRTLTEDDMRGGYHLLYFGYTYCPDICPTTLQVLSLALDELGEKAKLIQPYFITIDPERDSVKVMRNYVEYFDSRLIGVTGSKPMIERVAAQFKVKYEKVEEELADPNFYVMDHSASLYLLGPDGRFIKKYVYGITAEQLAQALLEVLP
ncbi:MAG: SCO family protein [Gammaproteobacteria bacterium]|nr:SCO family protein [Gammaproteobacteria bacterium]